MKNDVVPTDSFVVLSADRSVLFTGPVSRVGAFALRASLRSLGVASIVTRIVVEAEPSAWCSDVS